MDGGGVTPIACTSVALRSTTRASSRSALPAGMPGPRAMQKPVCACPPLRNCGTGPMRPMPGLVVSINVEEGQEVKAGEPLAVVEAMKMENVLRAEKDATIAKINARKGDSLAVDAVIMEFAPA